MTEATAAIHDAGSQARRRTRPPADGQTGRTTQATSPPMVAGAAAGSASTLASTPCTGRPGCSTRSTGWHATCAATGIASASARRRGMRRDRRSASGGASTRSPAVASTLRAKPRSRASQGSPVSRTTTATARAGRPREGRPDAVETMSTAAITAARSTLGCGGTRITNAPRAANAATARAGRRSPAAAASASTSPTMTAQFAPETAVRCVSELSFMVCARAGVTADASPIARPGSSSAPGPRRSAAASARRARSPSANPSAPAGPPATSGAPRATRR